MENAIATIIVAIIGLIGIIIQTKSHNKLKKQETILEEVDLKIDAFKKESKEDINLFFSMHQLLNPS